MHETSNQVKPTPCLILTHKACQRPWEVVYMVNRSGPNVRVCKHIMKDSALWPASFTVSEFIGECGGRWKWHSSPSVWIFFPIFRHPLLEKKTFKRSWSLCSTLNKIRWRQLELTGTSCCRSFAQSGGGRSSTLPKTQRGWTPQPHSAQLHGKVGRNS